MTYLPEPRLACPAVVPRCALPLLAAWISVAGALEQARGSATVPGEDQSRPVALVGGTVHPVSGEPVEGATVLFDGGRITAIGPDVEIPDDAERVDVQGKHVYPGLFDAYTDLGLIEINSIRATRDQWEVGRINPNVRAQVAVNPDSELIPVTRSNGILLALTAPRGDLVSGRSAVLQLDGWTYNDLTLAADVGLHIEWPRMAPVSDRLVDRSAREQLESRDRALRELDEFFERAKAYHAARSAGEGDAHRGGRETGAVIDARLEAMRAVLDGEVPVIVTADETQQIQAAVAFARRHQLRLIIYGGYDAPHCAELLREYDVPVILAGVYRLPRGRWEPYDHPFTLADRLRQAGIRYCISGQGRFGASTVRNLPYHAATAVAYGLPYDEALKAVTLYPAQILGVDDRVGSLEAGKDATLIVTTGDPLETVTHVERAYIQGRALDLSDRHKRLWEKYQEKYRRQRPL